MPAHTLYQQQMFDNMGFLPVWLPGDRMELGDVGVLADGRFHKESSLKELGIPYVAGPPGMPRSVSYHASASTKTSAKAGAGAATTGRGSVSIEFSAKGAFVFHAVGLRDRSLDERQALYADLLRALKTRLWRNPRWLVVEELYTADSATVLVSEDDSASIELEGSAGLLSAPALQLGDAQAGLNVTSQSGRIVQIVGGRQTGLLYSCVRLKAAFWGLRPTVARGGEVEAASGGEPPPNLPIQPESAFVRADISELTG